MYSSVQSYISIKNISDTLDILLFQISALFTYGKLYNKNITIFNQNDFIKNSQIFDTFNIQTFYTLQDIDSSYKIVPYGENIMLSGEFKTYKKIDDDILEMMREFIYSNEEYMYMAYNLYNNIKKHFNDCSDEDLTSIYYDDTNDKNINYYKKSIIIMNKKNIVIISPNSNNLDYLFDKEYNVYNIWHDNEYVRFILLSFIKHNIIQYSNPYLSLWASYISKYDSIKNVVVPDYIDKTINKSINNINFVYLN